MWKLKRIGRILLFPHISVMIILMIAAVAFLVYSMTTLDSESIVATVSYVFSSYTLTIWCIRIPQIIDFFKSVRNRNRFIRLWKNDVRLRVNISLYSAFLWNAAYGVFQLCLGLYHASAWYYSMAAYYICLAVMRFYLSRHTRRHIPGARMRKELIIYKNCGIVFLIMNIAISTIILFLVYWDRTFYHHKITTIAMAAYTFTTFTAAIINIIKYRRYKSPVFSASKAISLAAACVSMLTLTSTMLTTFGEPEGVVYRRIMLGSVGCVISAFIIGMAFFMIISGNIKLKKLYFNISET